MEIMCYHWLFYSPCIVDETCDFDVVGQRIAWAKYMNNGQVGQRWIQDLFRHLSQPAITCSKLTIEIIEQGVKYI